METKWGKDVQAFVEAVDKLASDVMKGALEIKETALKIKEDFKHGDDAGGMGKGGGS